MYRLSSIVLSLFLLNFSLSCGDHSSSNSSADDQGRSVIGRPQAYPVESVDDKRLNSSFNERRQLGWKTLAKSTREVTIQNGLNSKLKFPYFLTWYQANEFPKIAKAMFKKYSKNMTATGFRSEDIERELGLLMGKKTISVDSAFFQTGGISASTGKAIHGMMGPTFFSESMLKHYLLNATTMMNCNLDSTEDLVKAKKEGRTKSFSPCMREEFPKDSVMAKATWLPVVDNKFEALSFITGGEDFGKIFKIGAFAKIPDSGKITTEASPNNGFIIQDRTGKRWVLAALHVSTKETANWVWSSFWWSNKPNNDFGADRPKALSRSLQNYKSCITTGFSENDSSAASTIENPSLREAVKSITSSPSVLSHPSPKEKTLGQWCANPFVPLERVAAGNTCIGCHQGGGTKNFQETFEFKDERRKNFPGDFSIAFPSFIQDMVNAKREAENPGSPASNWSTGG
ncbi:MAG: hypothetical protein EOP04_07060 [Proteobacteria bacterium]|nr:MAG: hypothetical protein EOP04_07060 [Pseudomonadota bacterium]